MRGAHGVWRGLSPRVPWRVWSRAPSHREQGERELVESFGVEQELVEGVERGVAREEERGGDFTVDPLCGEGWGGDGDEEWVCG